MQSLNSAMSSMQVMLDGVNIFACTVIGLLYSIGFIINKRRAWCHIGILAAHCMVVFLILRLYTSANELNNAILLDSVQKALLLSCVFIAAAIVSIPLQYIADGDKNTKPVAPVQIPDDSALQKEEMAKLTLELEQLKERMDTLKMEFEQASPNKKAESDKESDHDEEEDEDDEYEEELREGIEQLTQDQVNLSETIQDLQEKQQQQNNVITSLKQDMQGIADQLLITVNLVIKLTESDKNKPL